MKTIFKCEFGSILYGTNLPTSDKDYKEIFIPNAKDIVLQIAPKTIVNSTKENRTDKNKSNDVDVEQFALHQYLNLLMQGQTVALDMLFCTDKHILCKTSIWDTIVQNKTQFLHKGTTSFVGYARQQAAKYGIKGTRIAAIRLAIDYLEQWDYTKIGENKVKILEFVANSNNEYIKIVEIKGPNGKPELHLEVCNRKIPFHATCKYGYSILKKIFNEYGTRALLAEKNEGLDHKALMHAVRVCGQAKELLTTGHVTFPRPEADILLKIRKAELPYNQIAEMIENGLEELEKVKQNSILLPQPNKDFANQLIEQCYSQEVINTYEKT